MRRKHLTTILLALALAAGALAVAGCGGGGSKSSGAEASHGTPVSNTGGRSSESDCRSLGRVTTDLALAEAGFDYVRARNFMDSFADRAPDEVADSAERIRDLVDRFASEAEKVGLDPGDMPLPDQAQAMKDALDYSSDDQAANGKALATLDAWVTNGCGS